MLLLQDTRFVDSIQLPVATGILVQEEGMPLVHVRGSDNITYVRPCTSTSTDAQNFAGVSFSRQSPPSILPHFEQFTLTGSPTTGSPTTIDSIVLSRAPIMVSGVYQMRVTVGSNVFTLGSASGNTLAEKLAVVLPDNDSHYYNSTPGYGIPPALLFPATDFNKALIGSTVTVQYLFLPTIDEARSYTGDAPIGGLPQNTYGSIGVLKRAVVATSCFDPTADWSTATHVGLGQVSYVNGNGSTVTASVFTPLATTPTTVATMLAVVQGVEILQAPTSESSFLKMSINV